MARPCPICIGKDREKLELALLGGATLRKTAENFRVDVNAVWRHKHDHMPLNLELEKKPPAVVINKKDKKTGFIRAEYVSPMDAMAYLEERHRELQIIYKAAMLKRTFQAANQAQALMIKIAELVLNSSGQKKPRLTMALNLDKQTSKKVLLSQLKYQELIEGSVLEKSELAGDLDDDGDTEE